MTGVPSSAAVIHITVCPTAAVVQHDLVLATLLHAVASLPQVTIQLDKKIPLLYTAEGVVLKQRNAIVRALIGTGLHGAMDHYTSRSSSSSSNVPLAAAGGHWSRRHASPTSAMAWASMLYWMTTVKEQILQQQPQQLEVVLELLSLHLKEHAFLVANTAMPTIADYDVALALAKVTTTTTAPPTTVDDDYPNVMRWMKTTLTSLHQQIQTYCQQQDDNDDKKKSPALSLPAVSLPAAIVSKYVYVSSSPAIVFFDGTEDATTVLQQLHSPKTAKKKVDAASTKATSNKKKQQQQQQAGESKKEKKKKQQQQPKAQAGGGAGAATTEYDISALDIRVGQIVKIWPHETADKLYCEDIDLGNGEIRQVASGLRPFYPNPEQDLQGKKVLVLANLSKRNLVGFPSHGMVLCASNADHSKVELVVPPADAELGQRVWFGSSRDDESSSKQKDPEPENKVKKKKLMELLLPDLKTNDQGTVVWKGAEARTSAGVVKAANGMANAQVA